MSVMTTVLAFDIACVPASAYGVGHHPRFLMHDSPREGDMEGPLFRRLFEIVHDLEKQFTNAADVSFQYIVTTTSEPPRALSNPHGPYVVLTLDATDDDGRLRRPVRQRGRLGPDRILSAPRRSPGASSTSSS